MLTPQDLKKIKGTIHQENRGFVKREDVREIVKTELRPIKKDIKIIIRFFDYDVTYLKQRMNRVESVLQLSPLAYRNGAEL